MDDEALTEPGRETNGVSKGFARGRGVKLSWYGVEWYGECDSGVPGLMGVPEAEVAVVCG